MGSLNVNRKLFKRSAGISLVALVALITLLVATGTVFAAAPIAGVGGFVIEAGTINGSDFELIPALTSTNTGDAHAVSQTSIPNDYQTVYPAAQVWLGDVSIDGLNLWKNISLEAIAHLFDIPNVSYVQVIIEAADGVAGENLTMNATDIAADNATFGNMVMMENLPTEHPNKLTFMQTSAQTTDVFGDEINTGVQIGMSADTMVMTNGIINTHYMAAEHMSIPGMTLQLHLYDASNTRIMPPFQNSFAPWD
ncbi:MAG: hypothetical protein WAO57_02315 [Syntrophomonadaceae bacterium]|nr:hypothetical protein [Bacillota bacterium]